MIDTTCPDCATRYDSKGGHKCLHTGLFIVPELGTFRLAGSPDQEPAVGETWWVKFPDKLEVLGHKILYVTPKLITFDVDGFEFTFRRQDVELVERVS